MVWQDLFFTVGQLVLAGITLPALLDRKATVPALTSLVAASVLFAFVPAYLTLGLDATAVVTTGSAVLWVLVFVFRRPRAVASASAYGGAEYSSIH